VHRHHRSRRRRRTSASSTRRPRTLTLPPVFKKKYRLCVWAVLDYTETRTISRELLLVKVSILGPEQADPLTSRAPLTEHTPSGPSSSARWPSLDTLKSPIAHRPHHTTTTHPTRPHPQWRGVARNRSRRARLCACGISICGPCTCS
jgi:hypothetical protein